MKTILLAAVLLAAAIFTGCEKAKRSGDVTFARNAFVSLAKGDSDARVKIDWPTLTAMGENVGAKYNLIPTETEKAEFQNLFVTNFSSNFRQNGGSVDNFTNWRVTFSDSTRTEVAADSPGGVLRLTVSERDSVERISSIDMSR